MYLGIQNKFNKLLYEDFLVRTQMAHTKRYFTLFKIR